MIAACQFDHKQRVTLAHPKDNMQKFKDTTDVEWSISLTLGSIEEVRDSLGVDLLQPEKGDPPLLAALGTDERLLASVISCLLADQFEANHCDDITIKKRFDGQTILAATMAFYNELIYFFHNSGRTDREKAVEKQLALIAAGVKAVQTQVEAVDVEAEVGKIMTGQAETPGPTSGGSPDSSE